MIIQDSFGYGPNLVKENYAKVMPSIEAIRKIAKHFSVRVIIKKGVLIRYTSILIYYNSITSVFFLFLSLPREMRSLFLWGQAPF